MAKKMTLEQRAARFAECQDWGSQYEINPRTGERKRRKITTEDAEEMALDASFNPRSAK